MKKRIVSLMLVAAMSVSLCACGSSSSDTEGTEANVSETSGTLEGPDMTTYGEESSAMYDEVLGDFYAAYQEALEASTVSERYALMAVAEAKLMESAVMLPTTSKGGRYAISRIAPYTTDYADWGSDSSRYHSALVATDFIKSADREVMKEKYKELKGTGTYLEWAKEYLLGAGYTLTDEYKLGYSADPETWDVLASSRSTVNEALVNCVDGLLEYDCEGVAQPALAESYEVSDDGLTYTFHLRQGVKWVNSQGQEIAEVKAQDFVNGFQHMMDTQSGLGDLESGIIVGVDKYLTGETTDMSDVGVEATDDYTVVYTLESPCSYFLTTLEYSAYMPLCTDYYASCGGKYGSEYDASASDYTYGVDSDHIAYCGPYLVSNATAEQTIVYDANPSYYDSSKVNVSKITWIYEDGSDETKVYTDTKNGDLSGCSLTNATLEIAESDGMFDNDYVYTSSTDATSYMAFYNVNRYATANSNDTTTVKSGRSDEDIAKTTAAMQNVHFRRAISCALDRVAWNAQKYGEDLAPLSLINSYTPGDFVQLEEEVTIDGLGTFAAGTNYGEIEQAQLDADGVEIDVWDPEKGDAVKSGSGYDGWYNVEYATSELQTAIDELAEEGIEVTAENPITYDLPYASNDSTYTNCAQAYKQSIESNLGGLVKVNLVACTDYDEWYYAGYYTSYGWEANYDMYDLSGWGPDYGDPSTFLNTFLPDYSGYMIKSIGIF